MSSVLEITYAKVDFKKLLRVLVCRYIGYTAVTAFVYLELSRREPSRREPYILKKKVSIPDIQFYLRMFKNHAKN